MKTTETFSPTLAKILLSVASVLGTLGGWAVLSARPSPTDAASKPSVPVAPPVRARTTVAPVRQTALGRTLRQVDAPRPAPVTFTRSSR